jgi:transcriptional regulator with XRE-family HTH domain
MTKKLTFASRLKAIRADKGVGVRELGRLINKTGQHISNIEKGIANPSAEVVVAIAKALSTDVDELLHLAGQVDPEVVNVIQASPSAVPSFLRSASNLTEAQWLEMEAYAKKLSDKT